MRNRIAAVAVLALAACGPNTVKLTAEGRKLSEQYAPQAAAIAKDAETLAAQAKALPAGLAGAAEVAAKVAAHQAKVAALKTRVDGFPDDLAAIVQVGKDSEIVATVEKFKKEIPEELAAAAPALEALTAELAALQAKAAQGTVSAASASAPAR